MRKDERILIQRFCRTLTTIAGEMSEQRLIYCLANLDQQLADKQKESDSTVIVKLTARMLKEVEDLTRGIEQVGFGKYMEDYPKVITAFMHEVEEETNSAGESWNDYNRLGLDDDFGRGTEDYEPSPYDGTYSEE
jgi:hypothetical protein